MSYTFDTINKLKLLYGGRTSLPYGVTMQSLGYDDPLNLNELSQDDLRDLGFGRWSENNLLYLIPAWLLPFLPEEVALETISGEKVTEKSKIDGDTRFGMLAYGVVPTVLSEADRVDRND